jgi:hypothetical protein
VFEPAAPPPHAAKIGGFPILSQYTTLPPGRFPISRPALPYLPQFTFQLNSSSHLSELFFLSIQTTKISAHFSLLVAFSIHLNSTIGGWCYSETK